MGGVEYGGGNGKALRGPPEGYYIAIASFTPGISIDATITATVSTGAAPPPPAPGGGVLTSGRAQNFTLDPVTGPTLFSSNSGYTIVVPQGATSLDNHAPHHYTQRGTGPVLCSLAHRHIGSQLIAGTAPYV